MIAGPGEGAQNHAPEAPESPCQRALVTSPRPMERGGVTPRKSEAQGCGPQKAARQLLGATTENQDGPRVV